MILYVELERGDRVLRCRQRSRRAFRRLLSQPAASSVAAVRALALLGDERFGDGVGVVGRLLAGRSELNEMAMT